MRLIYTAVLYLYLPVALVRLFLQGLRYPAYRHSWAERFGAVPGQRPRGRLLWLHAVSVGEVRAAVPLVRLLQSRLPDHHIHITTVTPTGAEIAAGLAGPGISCSYFPYDLPPVVSRFLNRLSPAALLVMESEIWPNLYLACAARGIKVILLNSRISDRSLAGYRRLGSFMTRIMGCVTAAGARAQADAARLVTLGLDAAKVRVTGNLKFDLEMPAGLEQQAERLRRVTFAGRPVWLAASTHAGEESLLLEAHGRVLSRLPDCLLVLVPRHPQRFEQVAALAGSTAMPTARYSLTGDSPVDNGTRVFLLDTMGMLLPYYAAVDVAFVGGSLVPGIGGHNMLEPLSLGTATLSGPFTGNFREITQLLCDNDALLIVENTGQLADRVCELIADPGRRRQLGSAGKQIVSDNRGAASRSVDLVVAHLEHKV